MKYVDGATRLDDLFQSGSSKLLFPRCDAGFQAVLVNTAGGITGGDSFRVAARAKAGARLTVTTQAAERAYLAQPNSVGKLTTELHVEQGGALHWLPQETILFQGAALKRHLRADVAPGAEFTYVEPLVFGREAMGETVTSGQFHDRVEIYRDGEIAYKDALRFEGDLAAQMARPAVGNGARAYVSMIHISTRAQALLAHVRELLPKTAGASLLAEDTLVLRALASDSFELRRFLMPILARVTGDDLPRPWMI